LVDLSKSADATGGPQYELSAFHGGLADCIDTLRRSMLFSRVETGSIDPDLYLTGDARFEIEPNIAGAIVAGITLFIAPVPAETYRWHLEARIMSARSQKSKDVVLEVSTRTWFGLAFLPVMPFHWPNSEHSRAKEQLCQALSLAIGDANEEFDSAR
jgi:hypothetical protein